MAVAVEEISYIRFLQLAFMEMEQLAAQLRKPEGEAGKQVADAMNKSNALMNEWAVKAMALEQGDAVLEIGMGNGGFVPDLLTAYPFITYEGCDYSEWMVKEASEKNADLIAAGKVLFRQACADNLPYEDESFSKIFGVNVLYFWEQPLKELAEIKRVLKPGGILVLAIRSRQTMQALPFTRFGFALYDEEDLAVLLKEAGFIVEDLQLKKEPEQNWKETRISFEDIIVSARKGD